MNEFDRRSFLTLAAAAAASALIRPLAVRAQQPAKLRSIGVLMGMSSTDSDAQARMAAFRSKLRDLGWVNGQNIRIDDRWSAGDFKRMQDEAAGLVATAPDVLIAVTVSAALALHRQTRSIPIVFTQVSDPIGSGLINNLAHPGGNITGFTNFEASMGGKWFGLLREVDPAVKRAGIIFNPTTAARGGQFYFESFEAAAVAANVKPIALQARSAAEINQAVTSLAAQPGGGLVVMPDAFTLVNREAIVDLARRYLLPTVYPFHFFGKIGGLVCYGVDPMEQFPKAAVYVDRILKGATPSELPVQEPTKFELVINLKTAKSLGITIPQPLLATADEVIE